MYERDHEFYEWSCDFCDTTLSTEGDSFSEAWDAAKGFGWRSFKDGRGEWKHKCSGCVGKRVEG